MPINPAHPTQTDQHSFSAQLRATSNQKPATSYQLPGTQNQLGFQFHDPSQGGEGLRAGERGGAGAAPVLAAHHRGRRLLIGRLWGSGDFRCPPELPELGEGALEELPGPSTAPWGAGRPAGRQGDVSYWTCASMDCQTGRLRNSAPASRGMRRNRESVGPVGRRAASLDRSPAAKGARRDSECAGSRYGPGSSALMPACTPTPGRGYITGARQESTPPAPIRKFLNSAPEFAFRYS